MTNLITLTIPNDDTIALRQFGKALIEIASEKDGHPVDVTVTPLVISTETLQQAAPQMMDEPEVDTTAQQVESLSTVKPFEERLELLGKALSKETPESLAEKLQSYNPEPTTDSTNTPWDERIHSASKALNADGTWRLRRKPKDMDEAEWAATIQRVQDELRFPQEPVPVTPSGEELCIDEGCDHHGTPHICVTPEPPVTPPGDDEQTVAGIPPLPVPPPVVVAPPVTEWDFPRLMTFLTEHHGKIDVATVNTLLAQDGMSSVQELNAHPDKIGPFVARVKAHLGE
nr:MAG TPA: hypothetical protein [Caudoviricetes sp.]